MKKCVWIICCLLLAPALCVPALAYESDYMSRRWVQVEVGGRITHFTFKDATKRTYDANGNLIGGYTAGISTYDLEEEQSYFPLPYVRLNFVRYVGLQFGWERIEGKTITDTADRHSNGNLILSGPSFLLYGRYPIKDYLAPYAGVGVVFFSADFEQESGWHADGLRNMTADDTTGTLLTLGTSVKIYEHLQGDISFSYIKAESDARYWMRGDSQDRANWKFPCDSWLFQVGVKYAF